MNEIKNNNNPILETKEFQVLLNLLEKAEQIISILNLPDSSLSKYNTLKKMTFDMLNLEFIPLQKRNIEINDQKPEGTIENNNETLNILYMLNTQKILIIQLLLDYIMNNNEVIEKKNLNQFLGTLTEIYNLSKEPFNKKTEEQIFYDVKKETNKLSEIFTKIDKILVDNFDAYKQIKVNYENELNNLREKYDKDLDELKLSLGKNSFQKQEFKPQQKNVFSKNNDYYLNQITHIIDESYEKYKRYYQNNEYENNLSYSGIIKIDDLKIDFVEKVMDKFFEDNNKLKKSDLEYHNCIDCNNSTNCCYNQKLNDICSFLPEMQKENDLFHKKFCELMNYIETNVEGNFK